MILKELTFGELAQCYFPNLIQSEAARKLSSRIKSFVDCLSYKTEREMREKGELDSTFVLAGGEIAVIGMHIGYPRDKLSEDVRDSITMGYNVAYEIDDPDKRKIIKESFMRLDSRLNPPLEIFDA